ncbi:MAG: fibronectin type III domain-containing protein, partial [Daejeonella sp.]
SVFLSYPPIINSPLQNSKVQALEPQNVIFQWVPRHTGSINAAYNVAYNFRLVELIPPERDPNDAIRSTRPLFETVTDQTILLYGPAEPALTPGSSYAVQVQAVEAEGKDLFINNGNSEVVKFTYGDKCAPPLNILAQLNDPNSLKFSWSALPLQQAFTIRYREANNQTAQWFEQEIYTQQFIAHGLRPGKTYEYQVKAQCINGYGDYTQLQQFQMPDEKFNQGDFVCGKQPENTKPDKKQLLDNLLSGNVFTAGDFSVTVTSVSASQNGKFSGTGTITVPVFGYLQFNVAFDRISINSKYQLVDGVVKVGVQGLETPQQGNGLKELSAALSGLSDAFDDLLKELKKDKPDPEALAQQSEAISSEMGSLQTDDEQMKQDLEGVKMLVANYITPGAWTNLDDPAVKEAKIAELVKITEKAKELSKKAAEVEKLASEKCEAALNKITSLINNRQLDINFLKLLACESNPEKSTNTNGKSYNISTYEDQKNQLTISYYSDAWPSSVDRLFLVESTDPKIVKEGVNKFWISYNPNRMYQDGKLPVTIYLKDIDRVVELNDPKHCHKDLDDLPKGISAGVALSDAMGEAVFYGATLGVSLEAAAAKKAAKCTGGVVLDVSFQLGINSLVKIYLGQSHEFSDLIKEVSIPSAASSCATAAFVETCSGKCAGLAGFAAGAGDDILKQLSNGKKLSEIKIEQSLLYGLRQGIIAILAQKGVGFAVSRWNKYTEKQLKDALADAESNPGKYINNNGEKVVANAEAILEKYRIAIFDKVKIITKDETLPQFIKESFLDNYYYTAEALENVSTFRRFGGGENQAKLFNEFSTTESMLSRSDLAIMKKWSTMQFEAEIIVEKGTKLNLGKIASQPGYKGGADQVLLPKAYPESWIKSVTDLKTGKIYSVEEFKAAFPDQIKKK